MYSNDQATAMDIDRNDSMSPVNSKSQHSATGTDGQTDTSLTSAAGPNEMSIQLQQAVLKTLQNISTDTLTSFMSPTTNTFKAVLKGDKQLVIWRKGLEVFAGIFEHHRSCKMYGFDHVAGLLIGYDGVWHLKITAGNAYSNPKWNDVWAGKFDSYGGLAKMSVETEDADMAKRASAFAQAILDGQFWTVAKPDIKAT